MKVCSLANVVAGLVLAFGVSLAQTGTPASPPAENAPATPPSRDREAENRVTLTFKNVPYQEALAALFKTKKDVSFVLNGDAARFRNTVTATIKDMPFDRALNVILRNAGLRATRKQGGVYWIHLPELPEPYPPQLELPPVPDDRLPKKVPEDFAFRIGYGHGAKNVLDTFNNTCTKDMISAHSITIPMRLTPEEKLRVYRKIVAIHFFHYPKVFAVPSNSRIMPHTTSTFKVRRDHQITTVYWDQISLGQNDPSRRLTELIRLVQSIVEAKPAYKKLPPPQGGYL
jgi:hypothetical protein